MSEQQIDALSEEQNLSIAKVISNPERSQLFYTRDEACRLLGIGRGSFYKLVNNGQLKARIHCNRTVVLRQDVETYLASLPGTKDAAA